MKKLLVLAAAAVITAAPASSHVPEGLIFGAWNWPTSHLPNLDGLEVTRLVRLAGHQTPIIGLTASVLPEDREKARSHGMDGFLGKPFTQAELQAVLLEVLSHPSQASPGSPAPEPH